MRQKKLRRRFTPLVIALLVAFGYAGWSLLSNNTGDHEARAHLTVYKSLTCGCCSGWIAHMRREGYDVDMVITDDVEAEKSRLGVPHGASSCHTAVTDDGRVIEGHIPAEVVEEFLDATPAPYGIALAGMPEGSPGMPGRKNGPWEIVSFDERGDVGLFTEF